MGIVIGIEAAICIAEAVETAVTAAAEVGAEVGAEIGAEAGAEAAEGAISAGTDAGTEAGADAAEEAAGAVEEGSGDLLDSVVEKLGQAVRKVLKMAKEYSEIDLVFRVAKKILEDLNPGSQEAKKLEKLIDVLNKTTTVMTTLANWLNKNANKETQLGDYTVSLQGVVSKFLPKLGAAAGILKRLSQTVATKYNDTKTPVTASVVASFETGIKTVIQSFSALAAFKEEHEKNVPLLAGMPISYQVIDTLKAQLPGSDEINLPICIF